MTTIATITSKNQLTIPHRVIKVLDFKGIREVLISVRNKTLVERALAFKN